MYFLFFDALDWQSTAGGRRLGPAECRVSEPTGLVPELRNRVLVYLLAYSGDRSEEVLRDPNDARRNGHRWAAVNHECGGLLRYGSECLGRVGCYFPGFLGICTKSN